MSIIGIDFGSRTAGTTAACFLRDEKLSFCSAAKAECADEFILSLVRKQRPSVVGIDAPLSLPLAYQRDSIASDFMYRQADRELGAMSPMFLGGLTARAINVASKLRAEGVSVIEVYPRAFIRSLTNVEQIYATSKRLKSQQGISTIFKRLQTGGLLDLPSDPPANWHELDSLLAFLASARFSSGKAAIHGDAVEGLIYV